MKKFNLAPFVLMMFLSASAFATQVFPDGPVEKAEQNPVANPATTTHDNLVILIDASGSMGEGMPNASGGSVRKMDAAKVALKGVIDQIPDTTHVGVLLFVSGGFGSKIEWLAPIGPVNKAPLKAAIDQIDPGGGTPLGQSIKIAADALLDSRAAQRNYGTYQLLVVTDGEATDGDLMQAYAPIVVDRGIQLDVIGVNMAGRHMLSTMAHRYWGANDTIALNAALKTAVQAETTGGAAAQADYDLLNGLPDDVAKAWLGDVTNMDLPNWHIGDQKPEPPATPGTAQAIPAQANQPATAPKEEGGFPCWILIALGIVGIIVVVGLFASCDF